MAASKVFSFLGSLYRGAHDYFFPESFDTANAKRRRVRRRPFEAEEKAVEWDDRFDPHTWTIRPDVAATHVAATGVHPPTPSRDRSSSSSSYSHAHRPRRFDPNSRCRDLSTSSQPPYSTNDRHHDCDDDCSPSSRGSSQLPDEVCMNIRSLLQSGLVSMETFAGDYYRAYGHEIRHRAYGYATLGALLANVPGVSRFAKHGLGDHVALDWLGDSRVSLNSTSRGGKLYGARRQFRSISQSHSRSRSRSPEVSRSHNNISPRANGIDHIDLHASNSRDSACTTSSSSSSANDANASSFGNGSVKRTFLSQFTPRLWRLHARTGAPTDPYHPDASKKNSRRDVAQSRSHFQSTLSSLPSSSSLRGRSQPVPEKQGSRNLANGPFDGQSTSSGSLLNRSSSMGSGTPQSAAAAAARSFVESQDDEVKLERTESDRLGSVFGGISIHNEEMSDDQNDHRLTNSGRGSGEDDSDSEMRDIDDDEGNDVDLRRNNRSRCSMYSMKPDSRHSRTTISPFPPKEKVKPKGTKSKPVHTTAARRRRRSTPYSNNVSQKHARTSLRRPSQGKKRRRVEEASVDPRKESMRADQQTSRISEEKQPLRRSPRSTRWAPKSPKIPHAAGLSSLPRSQSFGKIGSTAPLTSPSLGTASKNRRSRLARRSLSGVFNTTSEPSRRATLPAKKSPRVHGWNSDFSSSATPRASARAGASDVRPQGEGSPPTRMNRSKRTPERTQDAEEKKATDEFKKYTSRYDKVMAKVEPLLDSAKHLVADFENSTPLTKTRKVEQKLKAMLDDLMKINEHLDSIQRVPTQECIREVLKHPTYQRVYANVTEWKAAPLYSEDGQTKNKRKTYVKVVLDLQKRTDALFKATFGRETR